MTHTPTRGPGPGPAPAAAPDVAGRTAPQAGPRRGPRAVGGRPPAPRTAAWTQSSARLRAAATTEPGRLRLIGALLALLVLAFGAVTSWQVADRATAAGDVLDHSAPLSEKAAEIYRSLADADATVTAGFLAGGQEPADVAARYQRDITTAADDVAQAAAEGGGSAGTRTQIAALNRQLPYYAQLVATAQADNRQGLPLGGAYLRYANEQMRKKGGLLQSASGLYQTQNAQLGHDYSDAKSLPWAAWALGAAALAALVWAQRRHYRRTNRVFNRGMLAASGACAAVLLWLLVGHTFARARLDASYAHGAQSVQVLNNARIEALTARGDENLTLVARGSGESYDDSYTKGMVALAGKDPERAGGDLAHALHLADDHAGTAPVEAAIRSVRTWRGLHAAARAGDDGGDYATAVADVIGGRDSAGRTVAHTTGQSFQSVDASLNAAVLHESAEFRQAARDGRGALSLLPAGAALLAVLAAAAAVSGVGRRLSEYR